jgi:imidazole glycerol-phosphate synthase subunit HisH
MNLSKKVVIVDYESSNLFSVQQACKHVGLEAVIGTGKQDILQADAVILPGVGAFGDAMDNLKRLDFIEPIKEVIQAGIPFMGVCLGMQLLFSESEEFGSRKGLNVIEGTIRHFPKSAPHGERARVPQISWNRIKRPDAGRWRDTPFETLTDGEFMYFVHSYYAEPLNKKDVLSETEYQGITYCSSVQNKNVFATQFHPEKSAAKGLSIYKNWAKAFHK